MGVIVRYCRWGLAERVDDTIYLNENLKKPEWGFLHDYLLAHEQEHSGGGVTREDIVNDLKFATRNYLPSEVMFMIKHPKSWSQVLGVSFREGEICIDWINIFINLFVCSFIGFGFWWLIRIINGG
jgi:hypothetical protein